MHSYRGSSWSNHAQRLCAFQVSCSPDLQLSSGQFQRFWILYCRGSISIGRGPPATPPLIKWQDPSPSSGMRHIGLAAWDKFLAYRNLQMHHSMPTPLPPIAVGTVCYLNFCCGLQLARMDLFLGFMCLYSNALWC